MSRYSLDPSDFYFNKPPKWKSMNRWCEKISYYKNILNESYAPFVDKIVAKEIVKAICGDQIEVAPIIRVLSSPDDLQETDIHENHMIKASHGSGWNINCTSITNLEESKRKLNKWNIHYIGHLTGESQYKYIEPRFFIEEKISDIDFGKTGEAQVFMIRCIKGTAITISVRRGGGLQNSYDIYWNPIGKLEFEIKRPSRLNTMIYLAEKLSAPFEFVRVDFYLSSENKIYFSEYTFTPAGGNQVFNSTLEKQYGALWQ